jgi:hypothetical protein
VPLAATTVIVKVTGVLTSGEELVEVIEVVVPARGATGGAQAVTRLLRSTDPSPVTSS